MKYNIHVNPAWGGAAAGGLIGGALTGSGLAALVWPGLVLWAIAVQRCDDRRQEAWTIALGVVVWSAVGGHWMAAAVRADTGARLLWQSLTVSALVLHHLVCVLVPWGLVRWTQRRGTTAGRLAAWALALAAGEAWRQAGWLGHGYVPLADPLSALAGAALPLGLVGGLGLTAMACALSAGAAWWLTTPQRPGAVRAAGTVAIGLPMLLTGAPPAAAPDTSAGTEGWRVVALSTQLDHAQAFTRADRDRQLTALDHAMSLAGAGQLVVTPETYFAEPPPQTADGAWADLLLHVERSGATVLLGMPHALRDETGLQVINTALQLAPGRASMYGKRRLVPFGEYLPWPAMMGWVYERVFASARDGQRPAPDELVQPLFAAGRSTGVLICHEMSFALEAAERAASSDWLVVLSEDGWIDHPMYRQQMRALARLRAMETGLPLLRVANGGPTLLAAPDGRVQLMPAVPGDGLQPWPVTVPTGGSATPYARSAAVQWWVIALAPLAVGLALALRRPAALPDGVPA